MEPGFFNNGVSRQSRDLLKRNSDNAHLHIGHKDDGANGKYFWATQDRSQVGECLGHEFRVLCFYLIVGEVGTDRQTPNGDSWIVTRITTNEITIRGIDMAGDSNTQDQLKMNKHKINYATANSICSRT